jgi:hypothetical protein
MLGGIKSRMIAGVLALLLVAVPAYYYYFYVYPMAEIQTNVLYLAGSALLLVIVVGWGAARAARGRL